MRERAKRRELQQEAAVQERLAARDGALAAKLEQALDRLRADRRHLDRWMARDGRRAARGIAAQHELGRRREAAIEKAAKDAVARPPRHVVELIGERPQRSAPERAEWEAVVAQIERQGIGAAEAARTRGESRARAQPGGELAERIARLRERRGLERAAAAEGPGQAARSVDLGF